MKISILLSLLFLVFVSCNKPGNKSDVAKTDVASVYYNGDIITMEGESPQYVEALVVKDGKILFAGIKSEAINLAGNDAVMLDLKGKTLLPGFIDGHSHLTQYADALMQADLNPPPIGKINNIADIISALKDLKKKNNLSDTDWVVGFGYDQNFLAEKRHPTAEDLDLAFPNNPVVINHVSGHMLVANSVAFKIAGITALTKDPDGGTIIRKKGSNEPEGLVQEQAIEMILKYSTKKLPMEEEMKKIKSAQEYYAGCGVTTAADHLVMPDKMSILDYAAKNKILYIDVEALPAFMFAKELVGTGKLEWDKFNNHLKYKGIKLILDGSPQAKTAFLSNPYLTPVTGCSNDCKGSPNLTQEQVNALFLLCYKNNIQLYSHCNGDASTDMIIKGHEFAVKTLNDTNKDRRTVIVHSQIMRPDQLKSYEKYHLFPSFFTNHTYYWGDVHVVNLGEERAGFISPMKSAMDMGIRCTNHSDNIVTPLDPLFLIWTSVNRISRSGKIIGEKERITPYRGLMAVTINGAYEYFEEKEKGTLTKGKLADLVILDKNPLKTDPMLIKDIKVVETIKEGKTVFKRQ